MSGHNMKLPFPLATNPSKSTALARSIRPQPQIEIETHLGWKITLIKNHIVPSECYCDEKTSRKCGRCRLEKDVNLKSWPDMLFADNELIIQKATAHENVKGSGLSFSTIDALNRVDNKHSPPWKVAAAKLWTDKGFSQHGSSTYDWSFCTDYDGNLLLGDNGETINIISDNALSLPLELLRKQDKISLLRELHFFEDELDDNGSSSMTLRIRVMPSFIFILQRFFLRVDDVILRMHDTRIFLNATQPNAPGKGIREYVERECKFSDLPRSEAIAQSDLIWQKMPITKRRCQVLEFE